MKKSFRVFVLSLVVITGVIAVNRWDLPVMQWLCFVFGIVALVSGALCFVSIIE